jgi:hypothetical protein
VIDPWRQPDFKGAFPLTFPTIRIKLNWRYFEVGDIIETLSLSQKWWESAVRQVDEGMIFIHYNGWPDTWDGNLLLTTMILSVFDFPPPHCPCLFLCIMYTIEWYMYQ